MDAVSERSAAAAGRRVAGIVGELREFGVDVVPGEGVLGGSTNPGGTAGGPHRFAEFCQELFVVPAVTHVAHRPPYCSGPPEVGRRCGGKVRGAA